MLVIQGKGVFGAAAVGRIAFYRRSCGQVEERRITDADAEEARYFTARDSAVRELTALYEKALGEVGGEEAQIFDIHRMMLEDEDYNASVTSTIETRRVNAEYAVALAADSFASTFAAMDDEYMKARAADVRDVSHRVIARLMGEASGVISDIDGKYILCADDLTPSETVSLDKSRVLAFVTRLGSLNSHTAILARSMNIPAIVCAENLSDALDGKFSAVDGSAGLLYVEPDEPTLAAIKHRIADDEKKKDLLRELKGKDNVTKDGRRIDIYANIGGADDLPAALDSDAGGIGLLRSEFLYLERNDYPDEQMQYDAYREVLTGMSGKRVVIRTLDIGADKQIPYFGLGREDNPALGYRAIRVCLDRPDVFKTQLRALYRASAHGRLAIMFPMITALWEVREIKRIIDEVKSSLRAKNVPFSEDIELGVMIETPAAAIISDELAAEVDFFSIGTNDLTQYVLAADRQNPRLERFCDTRHPALLRLIEHTVRSAHSRGKWVGICGELAADPDLVGYWLDIGVDELSVSPPYVLPLRARVREI